MHAYEPFWCILNEITIPKTQYLWDSVEAILQKKLIALNVYIKKKTNHKCYEWSDIFPYLHANKLAFMVSSVLAGTRHNTPESEIEDFINRNSSSQNMSICDDSLSPSSHRVI